jgi:hypothetical protein
VTNFQSKSAAACGIAALTVAAAWLWLRVTFEFHGNLTGLYYTGEVSASPPELSGERIYQVPGDRGYDAQFYHYVAHDPLLTRGLAEYVDNPRVRWRRILVPALASTLAFGSDRYVDAMYVLVMLAFTGLGVYWLGVLADRPWMGLGFFLVPAVLISLDRMTIDLPLAALCVGVVLYGEVKPSRAIYAVLAAAPLVRETGILLIVGWCVWNALRRRWREVLMGAACALPALGWWMYVQSRTAPDQTNWLTFYPFGGLLQRTLDPPQIPRTGLWLRVANLCEQLALIGIWGAFLAVVWVTRKRRSRLAAVTALAVAVFAAMIGKYDVWADAYAAGRVLSPLLVMLALLGLQERRWWLAAPMLLVLPRVLLQYQPAVKRVLSGLFAG